MKDLYLKTVDTEARALISIANKNVIPRCIDYQTKLENGAGSGNIKKFGERFANLFDESVEKVMKLEDAVENTEQCPRKASQVRREMKDCSAALNKVMKFLKKDEFLPDL